MIAEQLDQLINMNNLQLDLKPEPLRHEPTGLVHAMRAMMIVVDMTRSIQMKDFKPSRLSITLQMIKLLIKLAKDATPVIKFALAIVENERCKMKCGFTYD